MIEETQPVAEKSETEKEAQAEAHQKTPAAEKEAQTKAEAKAEAEVNAAKAKAEKDAKRQAAREAKEKEKADKKAEREANRMPEQNGVRRPKPHTLCGQAWQKADELSAALQRPVSIKELLAATDQIHLNPVNVKSEYARWRKFNGVKGRIKATQ